MRNTLQQQQDIEKEYVRLKTKSKHSEVYIIERILPRTFNCDAELVKDVLKNSIAHKKRSSTTEDL